MIHGLGNIPHNLSVLARGNCLEYNTSERPIKFKMTKTYVITIKNDDKLDIFFSIFKENHIARTLEDKWQLDKELDKEHLKEY